MAPLTINIDGRDVVYTEPAKARAAARRYNRMARDLDGPDAPPEATMKMHELRARAKALNDWARREEDSAPASEPAEPAESEPSAEDTPSRRQAARALAATGIRKGARHAAKAAKRAPRQTRTAARRYERAGGVPSSSIGEFAIFLVGSIVALVLLEDVLTQKGATGFAKATEVGTQLVHRVIAPVPIVNAP